jgi:transposase
MPAPYSQDLRRKVIEANAKGRSRAQLVEAFGVSEYFVRTLLKRVEHTGSVAAKPHGGGRRPSLDAEGKKVLTELVGAKSDATLEELRQQLQQRLGTCVSKSALGRILTALELPRKKSRSTPRSAIRPACKP